MKKRIIVFAAVIGAVFLVVAMGMRLARKYVQSTTCGNYIVSIMYAARLWADDHEGRLPSSLVVMSNELVSPRILICATDKRRRPAASWAAFTPADSSYEIVNPSIRDTDTNTVFLRCKLHGHLGYADRTVFDGVTRRTKKFP